MYNAVLSGDLQANTSDRLLQMVTNLSRVSIDSAWIRVPLDESRDVRQSLQWRPLTLSENRVSENTELLHVLEELLELQAHARGTMPVLVDEKIYYSVLRMMHSRVFQRHDMAHWLGNMPLLYGVWHPYKQAVQLVYRRFFPVFALLEAHSGRQGGDARCHRKLLYMEKMMAALLLCTNGIIATLNERLQQATVQGNVTAYR